jgi:hypothetical protein
MRRIINNSAWIRSTAELEDAYILSWLYNCIGSEYSCLNSVLGITFKFGSDHTHPDSCPRCSDCLCDGELRERMSRIVNKSIIATIRLKSRKKHTYDGNQQTDPQCPLVQCPDAVTKESLDNQ